MVQATFSAKGALLAQQNRLNIIANNLANMETTGFKASRADFKDTLYSSIKRTEEMGNNANLQRGSGVLLGSTTLSMEQGVPVQTGQKLDFCITGQGFFTLQGAGNEKLYTRDGTFAISVSGGTRYLVNAQGYYVLDKSGNRITLPEGADASELICNEKGELSMGTQASFASLGIAGFKNPSGLEASGGNTFTPTEASGQAAVVETPEVRQGAYEDSNVDITLEMTRMIRAQRAFSFAARALTTADEMDGMSNNLRT